MNRIKYHRVRLGMGVKELARRAGVSPTTLRSAEMGERNLQSRTINAIAHALGVTVDELFGAAEEVVAGPKV
jgi:transcriptional regulator with XRE-family HTH domain